MFRKNLCTLECLSNLRCGYCIHSLSHSRWWKFSKTINSNEPITELYWCWWHGGSYLCSTKRCWFITQTNWIWTFFPVKFTFTLQHCDEILKPVFGKTLGDYIECPKVFDFEKHFGVFTGYFIVLYCFVFRKPLFTKWK